MKMTSKVTNVITQLKECWSMLFNLLEILGMLLKFLKVVMLCIMVLRRAHLTPGGIVMCRREMDFSAARTKSCSKKVATVNSWSWEPFAPICIFFFVFWKCLRTLGPVNTVSPSTSGESTTVTAEQEVSVSRGSTIKLDTRRVIPYPIPQDMLSACQSLRDVPRCFMPSSKECELVGVLFWIAEGILVKDKRICRTWSFQWFLFQLKLRSNSAQTRAFQHLWQDDCRCSGPWTLEAAFPTRSSSECGYRKWS